MSLEKKAETRVRDVSIPYQAGEAWAGIWETFFNIVVAGTYNFTVDMNTNTASSSLWIDNIRVVESICANAPATSVSKHYLAGSHNLKILLYDPAGVETGLRVRYSGDDTNDVSEIMTDDIFLPGVVCAHPCPVPAPTPPCPDSLISVDSEKTSDNSSTGDEDGMEASSNESLLAAKSTGGLKRLEGDRRGTVRTGQVHRSDSSSSSYEPDAQGPNELITQQSWQRPVQHLPQREEYGHHRMPKDRHLGEPLSLDRDVDRLAI